MNAGTKTQWLLLCRPQGVLEVRHSYLYITLDLISHYFALDLDAAQANTRLLLVTHICA